MNDILLSQEVAAVLSSGYTLGLRTIAAAQADVDVERPSLTISGEWDRYGDVTRKGVLTMELLTRAGLGTHATLTDALLLAIMGNSAKAAFISAITTRGHVKNVTYGIKEIIADTAGDDIRTTITLNMAWQFV